MDRVLTTDSLMHRRTRVSPSWGEPSTCAAAAAVRVGSYEDLALNILGRSVKGTDGSLSGAIYGESSPELLCRGRSNV